MAEFDWLTELNSGEMNLAAEVAIYLKESNAPEELTMAYITALIHYMQGVYDDLAEPFGIQMSKTLKNKRNREGFIIEVKTVVDDVAAEGAKKNNPDNYEDTAFHQAAELLGMSVHTVFSIYSKE